MDAVGGDRRNAMHGIILDPVRRAFGFEHARRTGVGIEHQGAALIGDLPCRTLIDAIDAVEEHAGLLQALHQGEGIHDRLGIPGHAVLVECVERIDVAAILRDQRQEEVGADVLGEVAERHRGEAGFADLGGDLDQLVPGLGIGDADFLEQPVVDEHAEHLGVAGQRIDRVAIGELAQRRGKNWSRKAWSTTVL